MKIFLDSNVLIDYWFKREDQRTMEPWYAYAQQVLSAPVEKFTSSYSIKHLEDEIQEKVGVRENFVWALDNLLKDYELTIIKVNNQHKKKARELMKQNNVHERHFFEDFVNLAVTIEQKADVFITRDYELIEKAGHLAKMLVPRDFREDR